MDGINVIDVHGAGCQRSDPKDGDPEDYPSWGHGPQGDVQRVFNYVRLVRDIQCGESGYVSQLEGDFSNDCQINMQDIAKLATGWQTDYYI